MGKMEKLAIVLVVLMAFTMFFGCTEPLVDDGTPQVTTQEEAGNALNDASTDLSGVKQTLDDIENTLTE
jgi:hypothetical protein